MSPDYEAGFDAGAKAMAEGSQPANGIVVLLIGALSGGIMSAALLIMWTAFFLHNCR